MSQKNKSNIAEKTIELDKLVAWFNSDEFVLEQALDKYQDAERLAADIESELQALRNSITIVKAKFNE